MRQSKAALAFRERFEEVVVERRWDVMARQITRRWSQPAYVEVEDVRQDLLIAAWTQSQKFDPTRAKGSFDQFVVYNAFSKAKQRAHVTRGALQHRDSDSNPSRFPRLFSEFENEGTESRFSIPEPQVEPDQETRIVQEQTLRLAKRLADEKEAIALEAIEKSDGTLEGAALHIYQDVSRRLAFRLKNQESASALVRRAVKSIVRKLEQHEEGETE